MDPPLHLITCSTNSKKIVAGEAYVNGSGRRVLELRRASGTDREFETARQMHDATERAHVEALCMKRLIGKRAETTIPTYQNRIDARNGSAGRRTRDFAVRGRVALRPLAVAQKLTKVCAECRQRRNSSMMRGRAGGRSTRAATWSTGSDKTVCDSTHSYPILSQEQGRGSFACRPGSFLRSPSAILLVAFCCGPTTTIRYDASRSTQANWHIYSCLRKALCRLP